MTTSEIGEFVAQLRAQLTAPGSAFEVVDEPVRGNIMPVFRYRARSTRELLEAAARFGTRTYLVDGDVRLDYQQHLAHVDAFATHLQNDWNIEPGDRVAIHSANRWEWVIAYWATLTIGAIPTAFNGWWTADETAHAAAITEPKLVIGDAKRLETTSRAGIAAATLDIGSMSEAVTRLVGERPDIADALEDEPAELVFTSGTTGRAKAVTIPHRAIVGFAQVNLFNDATARLAAGAGVPMAGGELPPSDDIVLVTSPLFHVSMLHGAVLQSLVSGSSLVLLPGPFDPDRVVAIIERERITRWLALGSTGSRVAASPALAAHDTSSLRQLGVGGAPVSPTTQDAIRSAFPAAKEALGMGYTSTEAGAVVAGIGGPEYLLHPTATGRVTVTTCIELRDAAGAAAPAGEDGRVHVRSPYVMLGYWNDAPATDEALVGNGWLDMGDLGRFHDDLLHIDSRARDLILVNAENVSPTEVEHRLEAHPDVREAAVFAVNDPVTGDAVAAVVSAYREDQPSPDELSAWCSEVLAGYKVPTRWQVLDEELPRTASGKLLKNELRDRISTRDAPPSTHN